ncbi:MAG: hypothetical protein AB8G05_23900 [Oligoflexales bacterium]
MLKTLIFISLLNFSFLGTARANFEQYTNVPVIEKQKVRLKTTEDVQTVTTASLNNLANDKNLVPDAKIAKAFDLLNNLENENIPLNIYLAGATIKVLASTGDMLQICAFAEKMEALDIELNARVYTGAIRAANENGKLDCAIGLLNAAIFKEHLPEISYDYINKHLDFRFTSLYDDDEHSKFYTKMPDLILGWVLFHHGLSKTTIFTDSKFRSVYSVWSETKFLPLQLSFFYRG